VQCYTLSDGTELPSQSGHDLPQATLYGVFPGADGYLVITAQVTEAWIRLARLIGGDALADDARFHSQEGRNRHREEILDRVGQWTRAQPVEACLRALNEAAVPCAKVQTIDEVIADPQIRARNMMIEQQHPVLGALQMPNLPFHFSGCDTTIRSVAPFLGQHNREIAGDLGYDDDSIAALERDGVLYAEAAVEQYCR